MRTIWKYPLSFAESQTILLPLEHDLLTVQLQNNTLCLWAIVNTNAPITEHHILVLTTGEKIPDYLDGRIWLNTVQVDGNVFHVFVDPIH